MTKISVIVITKNEEECINNCLDSVKWADEIIIVDSYSNDKTIEIAKKYTNIIYYHKFGNNYSAQRNFGLKLSRSNWVLMIDADERLPVNSEQIIYNLISNDDIDGYLIPRRNYIRADRYLRYGYFYPDFQLRLFRNKINIKYRGYVHEQPININKVRIVNSIYFIHDLIHSKYNSLFSLVRFFPYIKIEGNHLKSQNIGNFKLLYRGILESISFFYRSFYKNFGYKDGYFGFISAINYSLYRLLVYLYAIKLI